MKRKMKQIAALLLIAAFVVGCSASKEVTRLEPGTQTDLSGNWNDTDSRLVAEEMIDDAMSRPWLGIFREEQGRRPVVTVGRIRNNSSEHIDTETFTKDFERELLNSGQIRFVAAPEQRMDVRSERQDQADWASEETKKMLREELGADFILLGSISSIVDQEGDKQVIFYTTDLELINIESNEKVWIGNKKIKKGISRGSTKW